MFDIRKNAKRFSVLGFLGFSIAACASPDLTATNLNVTPTTVEQGATYNVTGEMRNIGAGDAAPLADGRTVGTWVQLKTAPGAATGETLTTFGPSGGTLAAGGVQGFSVNPVMSATQAPGAYFVCANADFADLYAESDETNNQTCVPVTVASSVRPDLVVDGAKTGGASGVSRRIYINVTNTGGAVAENFRIDIYETTPSGWPILLTTCALTTVPTGSAPCPSPFIERLEPGATETVVAWVTFPADRTSGASETLRVVADGCHPPTEPVALPAHCRVLESDEANNSFDLTVVVP